MVASSKVQQSSYVHVKIKKMIPCNPYIYTSVDNIELL